MRLIIVREMGELGTGDLHGMAESFTMGLTL